MKDDQLASIRKQEVDALTLKNKLGTRYNENRLPIKAKHWPGNDKYKEVGQ